MIKIDLAQIKLTNGSEIVCEVVEWPEDDSNQMIIRNAMTIINYEFEDGDRSYAFRPWIHFLDKQEDYIVMNCDHVMTMNRPTEYLIDQYNLAVRDSIIVSEERINAYKQEKINGLKQIADALQEILENKSNPDDTIKKETSNIIKFPINDIVH